MINIKPTESDYLRFNEAMTKIILDQRKIGDGPNGQS